MNPHLPFRRPARFAVIAALLVLAGQVRAQAVDPGWPRTINVAEGRILVYEPQVESLEGNILKGRGALSLTPKGKTAPVFGAIWFESKVEIDRDARTVTVLSMRIPRVRFPNSTDQESAKYSEIITREAGKWNMTLSLDRMIAGLNAAKREQQQAGDLNMDPPKIVFTTEPTLLVVFDGDPKKVAVHGTQLDRVVNTPYFVVWDRESGTAWLNGADHWFEAGDPLGPWRPAARAPAAVASLYDQTTAKPADQPGTPGAAKPAPAGSPKGRVPKILVSTEPEELIVADGKPQFTSIAGGDLLYMTNTESDVILEVASQQYYVLLSGRWFRSGSMEGPWEFVRADALPEAFAAIPEGSDKGDILAHVAGTPEAEEAVMDAAVPQTAAVKRSEASLTVEYDGEPRFKKIRGTSVEYAVNTTTEVLRIGGRYYACDQAVWFVADDPQGPWVVCDEVPEEVQQIPPESPVYNVKYVYVYDHTPDTVYVGYLPPYVGSYPYYGTVVWGTGYYYPGWWGSVYYPWPMTYGFHAAYNSYYGWSFGFGFAYASGPFYFSFGSWGYPGWWGPIGWVPVYHPWYHYPHHVYCPTSYARGGVYYPGTGRVLRGAPSGTNQNIYRWGDNRVRVAATRDKGGPSRAPVARGVPNNVYADPDGNIYRRTRDGWQTRDPRGWKQAPAPAQPVPGGTASTPPHQTGRPAPPTHGRGTTQTPPTHGQGTTPVPPPQSGQHRAPPATPPQAGHQRTSPPAPPAGTTGTVRPAPPPAPRPSLERDYRARQRGDQRVQQYRGGGGRSGGSPPAQGGGRPSGGGSSHGGGRPSGSSHGGGGRPHR